MQCGNKGELFQKQCIRSNVQYTVTIWNSYTVKTSSQSEPVQQRHAARFVRQKILRFLSF